MSLLVALALSELEPVQWPTRIRNINGGSSMMIPRDTSNAVPEDNFEKRFPEWIEFFKVFEKRKSDLNKKKYAEGILQTFKFTETCRPDEAEIEDNACVPSDIDSVNAKSNDVIITYDGRNLLDLRSNITRKWELTPTVLLDDITSYFQNRSQISWLKGVGPPNHIMVTCNTKSCDFQGPEYL